jgi:hypothetical protein
VISQNVVIPEAQELPTFTGQKSIPPIVLAWDRMLAPIGFNNQPGLDAGEIDKVRRDRKLTAKPKAELASVQQIPEPPLGVGRKPTQRASTSGDSPVASHPRLERAVF